MANELTTTKKTSITTSKIPLYKSAYPTERGSTVDSRQIVSSGSAGQNLMAVRIKHIVVSTQEMADICLMQLRSTLTTQLSFAELASQISACSLTRTKGGEIGWISLSQPSSSVSQSNITTTDDFETNTIVDINEHYNEIIPATARDTVFQITTKPGDICTVQSQLGYHLVQIVDVMVDVRKMAITKNNKSTSTKKIDEQQKQTSS